MYITINYNGRKNVISASSGENLAKCLIDNGFLKIIECGIGLCQKCAVKLISGKVSFKSNLHSLHHNLQDNKILTCNSFLTDENIEIEIQNVAYDTNRKSNLSNNLGKLTKIDPNIKKIFLKLSPPSKIDSNSYIELLSSYLGKDITFSQQILKNLPHILQKSNFEITVTLIENKLIQIELGNTQQDIYGIVADLGTSTVAVYLVNLITGQILDIVGFANPQQKFGSDVLSRISYCIDPESINQLQSSILSELNSTIKDIISDNKIASEHIYSMIVVGNTAMSHLFLGIDPCNLSHAPFVSCFQKRINTTAKDMNLCINPNARLEVLANISGFVGSDTLGVAMAIRPWEQTGYSLAVDIGTNAEILLAGQGKILACSTAAGPAFEGAHIFQGMRAGPGAIEKIHLQNGKVFLDTIGNEVPKGICGSGLMDCIGEFLKEQIITPSGSFATEETCYSHKEYFNRLRTGKNGIREFVLVYKGEYGSDIDIVITQKDIRELQLAKAAIAAGIKILCQEAGIENDQIENIYLAGAFGNYLNKSSALIIGLLPNIVIEKIISIGNASAYGAIRCLLSKNELLESDYIANSIKSVELSGNKQFNDELLSCLEFPDFNIDNNF